MESDSREPQTAAQWVTRYSKHVKNTRFVLMELAGFIDAGNRCPTHKELSEKTGLSKPTIQHALGELEKDGTVVIVKHGGEVTRGGKKNCYAIAKMQADPVKPTIPGQNEVVKPAVPGKESPGKADDTRSNPEDVRAYTHDAAGEQELLSKSSPVLSYPDKAGQVANTISATPPVNIQPSNYATSLAAAPPEIQAVADDLIAKAQPVNGEASSAPPPEIPPEPPAPDVPEVHDYWRAQLPGHDLTGGMRVRLNKAVQKHSLAAVKSAIDAAKAEGPRVYAPMAWIEARLDGQETEGKLPGRAAASKPKQKFVARAHQQGSDIQPPKDYPDDMQFEPPPAKTGAAKGAVAVWS